jgi:hypothetical protein
MMSHFTALIKKDGDFWIGWVAEVPGVNCQERTKKELLESLRVTLIDLLEINREDAHTIAGPDFQKTIISI